jgi:hypothetical protein
VSLRTRLLLLPVAVLVLAYATRLAFSLWFSRDVASDVHLGDLEFPHQVDLGESESGETAIGRFTIANRGNRELVIDEIRSSCSCSGLEREINGELVRIASTTLQPGERANMAVRLAVNGRMGTSLRAVITFHTSDPSLPEGAIEVVVPKVQEGIATNPTSVDFGDIVVGNKIQKIIEVWDTVPQPGAIREVVSTNPGILSVRLLDDAVTQKRDSVSGSRGVLIGRLEATLAPDSIGLVNERVEVQLSDLTRPVRKVQVSARIVPQLTFQPSSLILPRGTGNGPSYEGECLCCNAEDEPFTLSIESVPSGLTASVSETSKPGTKMIRIKWDPSSTTGIQESPKIVIFTAGVKGKQIGLNIPVYCRGGANEK